MKLIYNYQQVVDLFLDCEVNLVKNFVDFYHHETNSEFTGKRIYLVFDSETNKIKNTSLGDLFSENRIIFYLEDNSDNYLENLKNKFEKFKKLKEFL